MGRAFLVRSICLIACAAAVGCGGGGGEVGGSGLAFQAVWEQPAGSSAATYGDGSPDYNFGTAISGAVNTVRITLEPTTPDGPPSCCLAIRRGTQTFADRSLVLASVQPGDTLVRIYGYPTDYAPADGLLRRCATVPVDAGEACDATRSALPSFGSNGNVVSVVAGERTDAGLIQVWSLPFLVDVDPAPGSTVLGPTVSVQAGVVDAINNIVPGGVAVSVATGVPAVDVPFTLGGMLACDEQVTNPVSPCSVSGALDVTGYVVNGTADPVGPGVARVTITGSNDGTPPRSFVYSYEVDVQAPAPTTSTTLAPPSSTTSTTTPAGPTSTVTSTSVTTTTSSTTTTTLGPLACTVTFGLTNAVAVAGLTFDVDYAAAPGDFTGSDAAVSCTPNAALGALGAFNDNDAARTLRVGLLAVADFNGPADLATCDFVSLPAPLVGDFALTIVESFSADLSVVPSAIAVTDVTCN